jgi:formimidoylglutamate deiminase
MIGRGVTRLPGFVNAHSHTFQRALRGRIEQGDFWSWRSHMIEFARQLDLEALGSIYSAAYREMMSAGYTAVGEFHYLGADAAAAAVDSAAEAGIELVLLLAAYERGGIARFRQESVSEYLRQLEHFRSAGVTVGVAPHSVRACSATWLKDLGRFAAREDLVLHIHADEQPREIAECLDEYGMRPIELLAETGCLGSRTTVVHATHASEAELDLLADSQTRVCVCPTTEANLGDGFVPVEDLLARSIDLCIGSDSNVRIDPLEELREIEVTARRRLQRRGVISVETLLGFGTLSGADALSLEHWPPIDLDLDHPSLWGVASTDRVSALVFGCAAGVATAAPVFGSS